MCVYEFSTNLVEYFVTASLFLLLMILRKNITIFCLSPVCLVPLGNKETYFISPMYRERASAHSKRY